MSDKGMDYIRATIKENPECVIVIDGPAWAIWKKKEWELNKTKPRNPVLESNTITTLPDKSTTWFVQDDLIQALASLAGAKMECL